VRAHASEDAVGGRLQFHYDFIGFDFEKRLALDYRFAFVLPPGQELAGLLRHFESGHYDADRH
jgi:hypothetical protein